MLEAAQEKPFEVTITVLEEWYQLAADLKAMKEKENLLREKIFKAAFPDPKEGTNKVPLPDGWVLKATMPVTRNIDESVLAALKPLLDENMISTDMLVKYKPELKVAVYKALSDDQKDLFDQCLTAKNGAAQLEIVKPKRG